MEYDLRCDADGRSGALDRVASVGPLLRVRGCTVDLDALDPPPLPQNMNHAAGERRSMRCAERLLVENRCDLAIHLLLPVKLGDTLPKTVLIGVLLVALHAPLQPAHLRRQFAK